MQAEDPHLKYLNDTSRELEMLDNLLRMKSVILRFNTTIPSSAPVDRLLSINAALILIQKRNCLSDEICEKLLLLKVIKSY
jgi:hypothetical protein